MKCKECQELMVGYAQEELNAQEKEQYEIHLQNCNDCQSKLRETKELLNIIDLSSAVEPSSALRSEFMDSLNIEKSRIGAQKVREVNFSKNFYRIAAAVALLIIGYSAGTLISHGGDTDTNELSELKKEVQSMKQMVMMSMLRDESASERIQAVNYVEGFDEPSEEVIETLLRTLNEDESPNVRRAAINALEKFAYDEHVRLMLIRSFEFQTDPVVQITLIDLMVDLEEKRAAKKFQQLIDQEDIEKIVKNQAEIGLQFLI